MCNVLALDLNSDRVGVFGSNGIMGQFNLMAVAKSKNAGAYLVELAKSLDKVLNAGKYESIAIESAEYGINVANFTSADRRARMIGVVSMSASQRSIDLVEVGAGEVSLMATGRKKASKEEYLKSANQNGAEVQSEYVAHAYWVMQVARKKKNR